MPKRIDIDDLIHDRQDSRGTLCKKHAIVAVMSGLSSAESKMTTEEYYKYCDEFDILSDMPEGTSKDSTYNNGKESKFGNIFEYMLKRHYKMKSSYISNFDEKELDRFHCNFARVSKSRPFRAIAFNLRHAWAIVRIDKKLYQIDSLAKSITIIDQLPRDCGYVILSL